MSTETEQSDLFEHFEAPDRDDSPDRYDCRTVYRNMQNEADDGTTAPFRCGSWRCYCCGYRMRQNLIEEIQRVCRARPELSRLLTLTLDPDRAPDDQDEQHRYITERWNALNTAIRDEFGPYSFIWVREEQKSGVPHLHMLVSRYLPHDWLMETWDRLGGGSIVDIRAIKNVEKAAHYIGKYLTKDALSGLPKGTRRYGSSADIDLEVRGGGDDDRDWRLMMDDHEYIRPKTGEPIRRMVTKADLYAQKVHGGPLGLPPPD